MRLHCIDILNLVDYEVVNHRFLIVKGIAHSYGRHIADKVNLTVKSAVSEVVNYLMTDICQRNGRFNCLLDLGNESCNSIALHFSYGDAHLCVHVVYQPKSSKYKIQPLLVLAQDEHNNNEGTNLKIIDLNMLLVQSVFADKLREANKGRITFDLVERCRVLRCHLTQEQIWKLSPKEIWEEILKTVNDNHEIRSRYMKYMTFINCSKYDGMSVQKSNDYSYDNIRRCLAGHAALAARSVAVFSSAFFYSWPQQFDDIYKCFLNTEPVDLSVYPDDSNHRRTWCGVYASSLGAVCHESGHLFHLGHTANGFMGSGFDYINQVFIPTDKTEHLARRLHQSHNISNKVITQRCTPIRRYSDHEYLRTYHEQKQHEGFYITSNCALILCQSPWFRNDADYIDEISNEEFQEQCHLNSNTFESPNIPLLLLEVRSANDQVVQWYRESDSHKSPCHKLLLPYDFHSCENNRILFALSTAGHIAFFPEEPSAGNCKEVNGIAHA